MASRHGKEGTDEVKSSRGRDDVELNNYDSRRSPSDETRSGRKDNRDRRRSRSRSPNRRRRSSSRERRRSRSRERDRRRHDGPKHSSSRRHSPEKSREDNRRHKRTHAHHRRHRSRSSSTERMEKDRERSKLEMRQQMARNYEEQIERLKGNQLGLSHINRFPNQPAVEPSKLVEQIEKRKFLFKKDKPAESSSTSSSTTAVWKNTAFVDDSDGKMTAKFKRLMGMKDNESQSSSKGVDEDIVKKHDEYFANLEKQYEVARATTHTQRGLGLGFGSRGAFPVHPKP